MKAAAQIARILRNQITRELRWVERHVGLSLRERPRSRTPSSDRMQATWAQGHRKWWTVAPIDAARTRRIAGPTNAIPARKLRAMKLGGRPRADHRLRADAHAPSIRPAAARTTICEASHHPSSGCPGPKRSP